MLKFAAQFRNGKFSSRLEQWLFLIKNIDRTSFEDLPIQDELFEKVFDVCNYKKLNEMEKQEYENSVLEYEDVQDAIEYNSRRAFKEGKSEGIAEGEARGKEEGRAEGKAEERLAMAKSLLLQGVNIGIITKATGLTEEEIKAQI